MNEEATNGPIHQKPAESQKLAERNFSSASNISSLGIRKPTWRAISMGRV